MTATTPTARVPRTSARAEARTVDHAGIARLATYWMSMVGIYVMQGALWYYAAYDKIIAGDLKAPAGIKEAFAGSFIDSFPGVAVAWPIIAIAQAAIVVALAVSLVRGEFLPGRDKPVLMAAMAGSLVVLAALLFGQSMIGEHDSVASLFTYGAGTLVMMAAVTYLAPRTRFWQHES